jgi:hypothetical protein
MGFGDRLRSGCNFDAHADGSAKAEGEPGMGQQHRFLVRAVAHNDVLTVPESN